MIVEQSVNVALSIADRAVFMEKGQVRFDGPADELLERGDLLRRASSRHLQQRARWRGMTVLGLVTALGIDLNAQDLFDGAVTGLVYGFLAIGVILLYRASGIVNFAYGAIGSLAAVLVAKMCIDWNWPYLPALLVGVAASSAVSCAIEMTVVRRLFDAARSRCSWPRSACAVGDGAVINVPRADGVTATFPTLFSGSWQLAGHRARPAGAGARDDPAGGGRTAGSSREPSGAAITPRSNRRHPAGGSHGGCRPSYGCSPALAGVTTAGGAAAGHACHPRPDRRHPAARHRAGRGPPGADAIDARRRRGRCALRDARAGRLLQLGEPVRAHRVVLFGIVLGGVLLAIGARGGDGGAWSFSGRGAAARPAAVARPVRRLPPALIALVVAVVVPLGSTPTPVLPLFAWR